MAEFQPKCSQFHSDQSMHIYVCIFDLYHGFLEIHGQRYKHKYALKNNVKGKLVVRQGALYEKTLRCI